MILRNGRSNLTSSDRYRFKRDATESSAVDIVPPAQTIKMAVIVIATVPMLIAYPFVQNIFVKGAFGRFCQRLILQNKANMDEALHSSH